MKKFNVEKWGTEAEYNTLYITGVIGSGKTTLSLEMGKDCEVIHLDAIFEEFASPIINPSLAEFLDSKIPEWRRLTDHDYMRSDKKSYFKLVDEVTLYLEEFSRICYYQGKKVIMEGIQIFDETLYPNKADFRGYPLIILNTNYLVTVYRAIRRDNRSLNNAWELITHYRYFSGKLKFLARVVKGEYYSNCIIEAVRMKLSNMNHTHITYIPRSLSTGATCHLLWSDETFDYDFGTDVHSLKWYQYILFKGHINVRGRGFNESYKASLLEKREA